MSPQPGCGSKGAGDQQGSQAPTLQASGPRFLLSSTEWTDEPDRPSAEVLDCLELVSFDGSDIATHADEFWLRVRQVFSVFVYLCPGSGPLPRPGHIVPSQGGELPRVHADIIASAAAWIGTADVVEWLVPTPAWLPGPVCTFRDCEHVFQQLATCGIGLPAAPAGSSQPVLIGSEEALSSWDQSRSAPSCLRMPSA